ncbi:MAG: C-GCAxxG-C-C family protein [Candidatus Aminicenantes bacterium]|nr:C-GCAxxG-C-C family protein [Candidatus Aminicenantes bacterium]
MVSAGNLAVAGCLFGVDPTGREAFQAGQHGKILPEVLSTAEAAAVEQSILAKDLKKYFGQGYSCAESMLMVGIHYLAKPEELVWLAGGFGRGMYHRDVCGIMTGGIMALGLAAGQLKLERKIAKERNEQDVQAYWAWWTSQAPLRCTEIRPEGTKFEVCLRLGLLAAVKIEALVSRR